MQNYLTQRRHTALGVAGQSWQLSYPSAAASANVAMLPVVPFPLASKGVEVARYLNPVAYFRPPMFEKRLTATVQGKIDVTTCTCIRSLVQGRR